MPSKLELTFQRGADGRVGRWKKFYREKAYYLGSGRGESDLDSYWEALASWKSLKVKWDAERLWSRFRVAPRALQEIADIALASRK